MSTGPQNATPARSTGKGSQTRRRDEIVEIGIRLLDDAHLAWQRAELECEEMLEAWYGGAPRAAADWFRSYRAALDREEAAARDLERLWEIASSGATSRAAATSG